MVIPAATRQLLMEDLRGKLMGRRTAIDGALATLGSIASHPDIKGWLAKIHAVRNRYMASADKVLELMEHDRLQDAVDRMDAETLPVLAELHETLNGMLDSQKQCAPADDGEARRKIDTALTMMSVLKNAPAAVWRTTALDEA